MAKQLHKTPSELYYIEDQLTAYCFDNAVQLFGITLENKLSEIESKAMEGKGKNQAKTAQRRKKTELQKWLNSRNPEATPRGIYRDPANA